METLNKIIKVEMFPTGRAQWRTLGTEYSKSFTALKEIIDNSISAAKGNHCSIVIKILSLSNSYKISIEDNSGGVTDIQRLVTIATESEKKEEMYNIYGLGLKNCLAYFNDDYDNADWLIQSRTQENYENDEIFQIKAPYCYPNEFNEKHNHNGMNILKISSENYKGQFKVPGTYIEFTTPHEVFNNMNPLRTGTPVKILSSVAKELSDLISVFYLELLKKQKLNIDIVFSESNESLSKLSKISCEIKDVPVLKSLKLLNETKKTKFGGKMSINAHWIELNREVSSPFLFPQRRGLMLYVNGILVEPYKWIDNLFGGHSDHPSFNNMCLLVSVWANKKDTPELSVSKTKIKENGDNCSLLFNVLEEECPREKITEVARLGKSKSEFERRDKRFDGQLTEWLNRGFIKNLIKEKTIKVPNTKEKLKVDIYYEESNGKIIIEEFKKEIFNGASNFGQIIVYYDLLKEKNPESIIEIKLVAALTNSTTLSLIDFYNNQWKLLGRKDKIMFSSYTDLMIP
jgi:hypothetical protein